MGVTAQQKWNRYVGAINFSIARGYYINCNDSAGGNLKGIFVRSERSGREGYLKLKPKKYKPTELLMMIINLIGY